MQDGPHSDVPKNHKSARQALNALRSLRQGQDNGTYLVVDLDVVRQWNILRFSPFGCVPKKDVDPRVEARLIHDLSFPTTSATNAMSNKDEIPPVKLCCVDLIAKNRRPDS
ncbi:hypothetical protein PHMEG_00037930 [Phytophthora megakarya]|uniref:Uncharacterized protein n=1 Tax=Phytophthora megakarya TaxID=4795 RepID=A0A225UIQ7_9STRA|nr:hypothetical protein PHMEG_00037930 [Phytophthora megakarya]